MKSSIDIVAVVLGARDHCLGLPVDEWRRADFGFVVRTNSVQIVYVFGSLCDRKVYFFYHQVDDYSSLFRCRDYTYR
jgi:hypothetical protein